MHNSIYDDNNMLEIAAGRIQRFTPFACFGRNPDVDAIEDIWNYGATQTLMTVPSPLYVTSSAAAGDNTQTIPVSGIDDLWDLQTVIVTPNNRTAAIIPPGNRIDTFVMTFAALVAGPPAGTVITQASSGASMTVVGSDTTYNHIWGYTGDTFDLVGALTDPSGTMNPAAPVPTAFTACSFWLRVNYAENSSATALVGDLYIAEIDALTTGVPNTPARVHSKIDIGMEFTQNAHFSVPKLHRAFLLNGWASINNDTGYAKIGLYVRRFGGLFQNRMFTAVTNDGSSYIVRDEIIPASVPAQSDIKMLCYAVEAADSDVSAGFEIILEDLRPYS